MNVYEMEGFLRGKCLPGDIKVNESNPEYLVRKIRAVSELQGEVTALAVTLEKCREISGCPAGVDLQDWVKQLAAENVYLIPKAASELSNAWVLHKYLIGIQAAIMYLDNSNKKAAQEWLYGTIAGPGFEFPDEVDDIDAWATHQMRGSISHTRALEIIKEETPATNAAIAGIKASAIPEGFKLVPEQMYLSDEDIQAICMQCGNGDKKGYGDYEDGILWVGELSNDGEMKYGLNIANANYPEEGSITVFEFDEPLREGVDK